MSRRQEWPGPAHVLPLLPALLISAAACRTVRAGTTIVANLGPHASARAAAGAEEKTNWLDDQPADDTVCTECFAAVELQHYLRKMTGRAGDFAIVDDEKTPAGDLVLVGPPGSNASSRRWAGRLGVDPAKIAELGPQGYRIRSAMLDGRRVTLLAGGSRIGTLYAAYDLLHRLGCRWFAPGELHEEIAALDQLPDLDVSEKPDFFTRGFFAWENRGNPEFLLWMARNRMNFWCVEQRDHPLMRKLGIQMGWGQHLSQEMFLNPASEYPYNHGRFQGDDSKPRDPYPMGQQYQGDANGDGKLCYFEAHPEWYAFDGKRRIPGIREGFGWNYCTSNPHATAEFMKNFVEAIVDGPCQGADVVRLWTLDVGKWCQCPECKKLGTPTDRNLLLVRRLDREIKKARADGRIARPLRIRFLAYADVIEPPSRALPEGFDYQTCVATFFPINRCYVHNIDRPDCPRNARYMQQLYGWTGGPERHYRGQVCLGEYYNVSGFKGLPICFMHTMANDIPVYYRAGARHFHYMHCTTGDWGNKALTNYQMARQLWDVKTDCAALWQDYFSRRYGAAAGLMRRFCETLEKTFCNVRPLKYTLARQLQRGAEDLFPTKDLQYEPDPRQASDRPTLVEIVGYAKACRELIDQAMKARVSDRVHARIAEDERLFAYGERTVGYYHACVQAFQLARAGRKDEARRQLAEAKRLANLLRQDTTSTQTASSHANAPNALDASRASGAIAHLEKLLGQ